MKEIDKDICYLCSKKVKGQKFYPYCPEECLRNREEILEQKNIMGLERRHNEQTRVKR